MTAKLIGPCCCKCCVTLRYRVWLTARMPGLGGISVIEWEIIQGNQTESGTELWNPAGNHAYPGYFDFHNATDSNKAPIYITDPAAAMPVWISQPTGYIEVTGQSDSITWSPPYAIAEKFCPGTIGQLSLKGSDIFSETVFIQTGTDADLPQKGEEWWEAGATYKYGYTQWREVELCEE